MTTTYRNLSPEDIAVLERNSCRADNWQHITVAAEGFVPERCLDVEFHGECRLGRNDDSVRCDLGICLPTGIRHTRIISSTVADNSLVENVAVIAGSDIGSHCLISGVNAIITTEASTFGQGNAISVLNEAGEGNVVLYSALTSQIAAITALPPHLGERHPADDATTELRRQAKEAIRRMVMEEVRRTVPKRTLIGDNVRIQDVGEIVNAWIADDTEIRGAKRISDSTLAGEPDNAVFIGAGVICDGCIVTSGSSLTNNVVAKNCFVGECSTLTDAFSATDSLFFANSYMANGEACASFCGPFSTSHHKGSLLIGGMFSFYNAGSATNFSNHAYKMGPLHYGMLEHGSKTASGAHILWPARIGAFSMCMGKIATHPDTSLLPFSYVIGDGQDTWVVPGRNIATVGTFRDVRKWPKRDTRPLGCRHSRVDTSWLNPLTVQRMLIAKQTLEQICDTQGLKTEVYECADGSLIKNSSLRKGIALYSMALKMYLADRLDPDLELRATPDAKRLAARADCVDLAGMTVSRQGVTRVVEQVMGGDIDNLADLSEALGRCDLSADRQLERYLALKVADDLYGWDSLDRDDRLDLIESCQEATADWRRMIRLDAEREFRLGDVDEATLKAFVSQID